MLFSTSKYYSLHPDSAPVTPAKFRDQEEEGEEESAAAAATTIADDRDGGDVTITTSGYETFELQLQLQQQFYPGV